jgi:hypothetical protein
MRRILLMTGLLCAPIAGLADDFKVNQLELEVRELQRQVQMLSRQIDLQHLQPAPATDLPALKSPAPAVLASTPEWVDAARWKRLMPGMSELQVVAALGPPTSMRMESGQRVLLYAMEIGSSGFLGGSVTLRDRVVISFQTPVLQ